MIQLRFTLLVLLLFVCNSLYAFQDPNDTTITFQRFGFKTVQPSGYQLSESSSNYITLDTIIKNGSNPLAYIFIYSMSKDLPNLTRSYCQLVLPPKIDSTHYFASIALCSVYNTGVGDLLDVSRLKDTTNVHGLSLIELFPERNEREDRYYGGSYPLGPAYCIIMSSDSCALIYWGESTKPQNYNVKIMQTLVQGFEMIQK